MTSVDGALPAAAPPLLLGADSPPGAATGQEFRAVTFRLPRAPESEDKRIRDARQRLELAEQRVLSMRTTVDSVPREFEGYGSLVKRLHLLERSVFSRRLELDELLREQRRRRPAAPGQPSEPTGRSTLVARRRRD
jgi:hypothetical protein